MTLAHTPRFRTTLAALIAAAVVVTAAPAARAQDAPPSGPSESSTTTVPEPPTSAPVTTTTTTTPPTTTTPAPSSTVPTTVPEPSTTLPGDTPSSIPSPPPDGPSTSRRWSLAPRFEIPADDSIAAVQTLLNQVIASEAALEARRTQLRTDIGSYDQQLRDLRAQLRRLVDRRKARAVSAFINGGSFVESKIKVTDERVRLIDMLEGIEVTDAATRSRLEARVPVIEGKLATARAELERSGVEVAQLAAAHRALQDKLSSAMNTTDAVPVGPTDIAAAAAEALTKRRTAVALFNAGDAPAAAAAVTETQSALTRLADLVARPTPGAYLPDGQMKSMGPTPIGDPVALSQQLVAAWSQLDDRRLTVMLFALQQVGKRYVWAAAGPSSYDCSGLLMRAWFLGGVRLTHFSGSQIASGPPVPKEQLAPTDFLGYGPSSSEHITMYIGAGRVVEAKGSEYGVIVNNARMNDLAGTSRIP